MTEDVKTQDGDNLPDPPAPTPDVIVTDNADGGGLQQPEPDTKTFTQEELNRINKRTKEQARSQAIKELIEGLGLKSADDLADIVKAKKEAEDAAKSELDRALEAKAQAEQQAEAAIEAANDRLIRAAFLAEAGKVQAQHPQDAYLLADRSQVEIGDDGEVVGVEEAVKALVESGRLLTLGKPKAPNLDNGAGGGEKPKEKAIVLSQEEINQAQKMGISLEDYAKHKTK